MKRIGRTILAILLVMMLLASQTSFAAVNVVDSVKLNQVQQNKAELTMYVNMSDSSGYPCSGDYSADQFSISVDGRALDVTGIQAFDPSTQGIHYVFSVDVSRSLSVDMMNAVRNALSAFVDNMGPLDTVSLITFGEQVKVLVENSSDREQLKAIIGTIDRNEGMTALYKGVLDGIGIASTYGSRSAVIVITDGKNDPTEEMKPYTKDSIYESVQNAQVPMYCIGLNDKNGVDTDSLIELALVSGGNQYIINYVDINNSLQLVSDIMCSAIVLRANLVNADGRAGFVDVSTFKVGFEPKNGGFVVSNDLQQNINWKHIPGPSASPTPTPELSLSLAESEVYYTRDGEKVTITGTISVKQGVVSESDLIINVNGMPWSPTLHSNGNGYTFKASGYITGDTHELEVWVQIKNTDVAVSGKKIRVVHPTATPSPTPVPTATPAPVISVELDDNGDQIIVPGKVIVISGAVNVQGVIDPEALKLYINEQECPMSIRPVNRSQYEFEAEYVADEKTSTKFSIQMHLDGTQIYSRAQRMYFSTPSPTPNPEIDFALSDASIIYEKGKPLTIRGSIEIVSGVVAADDLALYVDGVKWEMALTERSDGSFSFEAQNELFDTSVSQLDVKVRLLSNTRISTASEKLEIVVPTATPSPSPTPRTVPTPPPAVTATPFVPGVTASAAAEATAPVVGGAIMPSDSAEPSGAPTDPDASQSPNGSDADPMVDPNAAVEAGSIMDQIKATINNMVASGTIWYVVAGIVLIIAMIVVLIIFLAGKGKGRNDAYAIKPTGSDSSHFSTDPRDWGTSVSPTSREGEEIQTVRNGSSRNADFVSGDGSSSMDPFRSDDEGASSTMRINMVNAGGGTVRLDDNDGEAGGTQRLEDDIKSVDVTLEETRGGRVCNEQNLHIECDQEVLIGRSSPAQVCIDDGAVSSRHMKISYDGVCVYITDVGSTNGTKVNGETLKANVPVEVNSGDVVRIGKTTIKLTINEY